MLKENLNESIGFEYIQPYLGTGYATPPGWKAITNFPLIIIVGVTGTGKTTFTNNLVEAGYDFELLPDRRDLTDQLIIAPLQREDHQEVRALPRMQRVPYIRHYQQRHPAGLAYAISQLYVDPAVCSKFLIFNGLRGESEVQYSIDASPKSQFIVLDASNIVRAKRLLERKDSYDRTSKYKQENLSMLEKAASFDALGVPEAAEIFSLDEEQSLLEMTRNGNVTVAELRDILQLLCVERSLYNKDETIATLLSLAPERTLVIDTTTLNPKEVTKKIIARFQELGIGKYGSSKKLLAIESKNH
jgi:hypothetical protein